MIFESVNEAILALTRKLLNEGSSIAPRGNATLELQGVHFVITDPLNRITTLPTRNFSLPLAVGELCWHLCGNDDLNPLAYYASAWRSFTDDGITVPGSCYGKKLRSESVNRPSAWNRLVDLLKSDPSSRRAVFNFITNDENLLETRDVSCVSSVQFLVRHGKLDMYTFMRSNDLFLGVPYDVFLFSTLMELMAMELGVGLGNYHHFATSMHLYERNLHTSQRILMDRDFDKGRSPKIETADEMVELCAIESTIRNGVDVPQYEGRFESYVKSLSDFGREKRQN